MSWSVVFIAALLAAVVASHSIKHIIVVMEENRSFDHFLGWRKGVTGLNKNLCNYVEQGTPSKGKICVTQDAKNIAPCDPDHSLPPTTAKIFGMPAFRAKNLTTETMSGFVEYEAQRGEARSNYCAVMDAFSPEHLPVMNAMADEFALFDKFYAALPGPTWPNRLFFLSGTSGGLTETSNPWFLGQTGVLFPQRTVFDQVKDAGKTWKNYVNDTPWELFLESVAHNPENVQTMDSFFADAKEGTLPSFGFINPRAGCNMTHGWGSNDHHPDHDVALGEMYYKDIYEALRASPQWNDTLLIVTYDEHGGFYDHVPPPRKGVPPPGDGLPSYPDNFAFDRLGMRIPTLLLGPWVPKGRLIKDPPASAKPSLTSEYDLTSIMATVRKILKISEGPLTNRDAWSATFEHILEELKEPRTDCPMHLPDSMKPAVNNVAAEAELPLNTLQRHISTVHAHLSGETAPGVPKHLKKQGQVSEWLQKAFAKHKEGTMRWKASKALPERDAAAGAAHFAARAANGHTQVTAASLNKNTQRQGFSGGMEKNTPVVDEKMQAYFIDERAGAPSIKDQKAALRKSIKIRRDIPAPSTSLQVRCEPFIGLTPPFMASKWIMSADNTVPFRTIMIQVQEKKFDWNTKFCMDAGNMTEGSVVSISHCYPSEDPKVNRDPKQQWVMIGATIRPYARKDLCLANTCLAMSPETTLSTPITLEPCQNTIAQHWEYGGQAPGNTGWSDEGLLANGAAIYGVVVDRIKS